MIKPKPLGGLFGYDFILNNTLNFLKFQTFPWALLSSSVDDQNLGTKRNISSLDSDDLGQYFIANALLSLGINNTEIRNVNSWFEGDGFLGNLPTEIYLDIPLIQTVAQSNSTLKNSLDEGITLPDFTATLNYTTASLAPFYIAMNTTADKAGYEAADIIMESIQKSVLSELSKLSFLKSPEFSSIQALYQTFLAYQTGNESQPNSLELIQNLLEYKTILKKLPMGTAFVNQFNSTINQYKFTLQFGNSRGSGIPNIGLMPTAFENYAKQISGIGSSLLKSTSGKSSSSIVHGLRIMPQFQFEYIPGERTDTWLSTLALPFILSASIPIFVKKFIELRITSSYGYDVWVLGDYSFRLHITRHLAQLGKVSGE
ncbi:hypothetical protein AYI68_g6951 [Smittium mucronatum]|uniref:Uncharacterized protein n=1 Tax=Smittium mucronatum TaxID=133383 RepID=A0A1R0GQ18_9FUNG|nr:hypothetical protein AYI68_g6951 [Smittium mucronatum]